LPRRVHHPRPGRRGRGLSVMGDLDRILDAIARQPWTAYLAIVLIAVGGAAAAALALTDRRSPVRRVLDGYVAALDSELKFLLLKVRGARILEVQGSAVAGLFAVAFVLRIPGLIALIPLVAITPLLVLRRRREKRIVDLELQLDGWLMILSNALKAAPSLG